MSFEASPVYKNSVKMFFDRHILHSKPVSFLLSYKNYGTVIEDLSNSKTLLRIAKQSNY